MAEHAPFLIRRPGTNSWLAFDIDSSGMSVFWTGIQDCDEFASREAAKRALDRVKERYPHEKFEIIPYSKDDT